MPFENIVPNTTSFINAVDEITEAANAVIPMTFVEDWLGKYQWHYEQLSLPLSRQDDESIHTFHSLYFEFSKIAGYYGLNPACENAMQEYNAIIAANASIQSNVELTEWTRKYEKMGMEDLSLFPFDMDSVNIVRTIKSTIYVVSYDEFKSVNEFMPIFYHLFWDEKVLPESIERMKIEWEKNVKSEEDFNKQVLNDYPHVICDECKLLGGCKKYTCSGFVDENHLNTHCPFDDIKNSMCS